MNLSLIKSIGNFKTHRKTSLAIAFFSLFGLIPSHNLYAINLTEAYELALQNDPQLNIAKQELRANIEQKNIAKSQLLPKLNANATYRDNRKQSIGHVPITLDQDQNPLTAEIRALRAVDNESDEINSSWGFTLSQPLFDLSSWFNYQKGTFESELAKLKFEAELIDLIRRVTLNYLNALEAQQNLNLSEALEESEKSLLTQVTRMKEAGVNTNIDVYQAMAALDASTALVLDDTDTLNESMENLNFMTGSKLSSVWQLTKNFEIQTELSELSELLTKVKLNNFQLKISEQEAKIAKASADSAKLEHSPKIGIELQYSKYEIKTDEIDNTLPFEFESDVDDAAITITATVPIYSGGLVSANRRQTYRQYLSSQERHNANWLDINRKTTIGYRKAKNAERRLKTYNKALDSNEKALKALKRGFEVGDRSLNDVILAQKNFYEIQKKLNQSRLSYLQSVIDLKALTGTLSPSDIIQINGQLTHNTSS